MKISVDDIKLYPKNAKKHPEEQIELIAQSLIRFGWQQPMKLGKDLFIIAGHGRILAYKKYPNEIKIPWVINEEGKTILGEPESRKLTEDEEKAYRIVDNKIAESDWEMKLVIEELNQLPIELQELTGFSVEQENDDVSWEGQFNNNKEIYNKNFKQITFEIPKEKIDDIEKFFTHNKEKKNKKFLQIMYEILNKTD